MSKVHKSREPSLPHIARSQPRSAPRSQQPRACGNGRRPRCSNGAPPCITRCNQTVCTETEVCPRVRVAEKHAPNTSFDIILETNSKPRMRLRERRMCSQGPCKTMCVYSLDVCIPTVCQPRVVRRGGNPRSRFDLDVELATRTRCAKINNTC
jgi:hypothetical protein